MRSRPLNAKEVTANAQKIAQIGEKDVVISPPASLSSPKADREKHFSYDKCYDSQHCKTAEEAQEAIFKDLGLPLIKNAFAGYNNCILAYGQTGSGKSYSMVGDGRDAGIIPRICRTLFKRIAEEEDPTITYTVEVAYFEIYNEQVRDLLNPTGGRLKVREHPHLGPYVEDLARLAVATYEGVADLIDQGDKARTVAATQMNESSSRSHAVFTLILTQKIRESDSDVVSEKVSRLNLVDLAGSERIALTGATGTRLKEGVDINKSLSTLGRVISALADLSKSRAARSSIIVPYRDSILTWILKDSLGGNSLTSMIATISPADCNYEETLSTLRYAHSAKKIKTFAVVNEDANAKMVRELKEELAQLRMRLSMSSHEHDAFNFNNDTIVVTLSDGTSRTFSRAELAAQLEQSQKLFSELNETWEQKLHRTQEIQRQREAALDDLGISVIMGGVGLHTPKRTPHLVNLSEDPLLSECLVYNIRPGITVVGNGNDASDGVTIKLRGSKILNRHCHFENKGNTVTLSAYDGARVLINGLQLEGTKRLRSGYRIIFGDMYVFRFNNPDEARADRERHHRLQDSRRLLVDNLMSEPLYGDESGDLDSEGASVSVKSPAANSNQAVSRKDIEDVDVSLLSDEKIEWALSQLQSGELSDMPGLEVPEEATSDSFGVPLDGSTESPGETIFSRSDGDSSPTPLPRSRKFKQARGRQHSDGENLTLEERQMSGSRSRSSLMTERKWFSSGMAEQSTLPQEYVRTASFTRMELTSTIVREAVFLSRIQQIALQLFLPLRYQFSIMEGNSVECSVYDMVTEDGQSEIQLIDQQAPEVVVRVADLDSEQIYFLPLGYMKRLLPWCSFAGKRSPDMSGIIEELCEPRRNYSHIAFAQVPLNFQELPLAGVETLVDCYSSSLYNVACAVKLILSKSAGSESDFSFLCCEIISLSGLSERELSEVHLQLRVVYDGKDFEEGARTTMRFSDFGDSTIPLNSIHQLLMRTQDDLKAHLRIDIFAKAKSLLIEKTEAWDAMRDSDTRQSEDESSQRYSASDFVLHVEIQELDETGSYRSVDVEEVSGASYTEFSLHQGLERRLNIRLEAITELPLPLTTMHNVRLCSLPLCPQTGKLLPPSEAATTSLNLLGSPILLNTDGNFHSLEAFARWQIADRDSSYFNHVTSVGGFTLSFTIGSPQLPDGIVFEAGYGVRIVPRTPGLTTSVASVFYNPLLPRSQFSVFRVLHGPMLVDDNVSCGTCRNLPGDHLLGQWHPRGPNLVQDFLAMKGKMGEQEEHEEAAAGSSETILRSTPMRAVATEIELGRATKEGYLRKQEGSMGSWKSGHFELRPPYLLLRPSAAHRTITYNISDCKLERNPKLRNAKASVLASLTNGRNTCLQSGAGTVTSSWRARQRQTLWVGPSNSIRRSTTRLECINGHGLSNDIWDGVGGDYIDTA